MIFIEVLQHQKQEVAGEIRAQVLMRVSQLAKVQALLLSLLSCESNPVLEDAMSTAAAGTSLRASAWIPCEADDECDIDDNQSTAKSNGHNKAQICLKFDPQALSMRLVQSACMLNTAA